MRAQRWQAVGPDEFEFVDVEVPAPGPGEVTIRVTAAGVNPADQKHAARATAYPWPMGYEIAGEIIAVGEDVTSVTVGDAVLAFRVFGGFTTAITVPARDVFRRPASLSEVEAATLLLAATTASDMLHTVRATENETIVVFGASGSVGIAALTLGRRLGAHMIGVSSPRSRELVEREGATWLGRDAAIEAFGSVGAVLDASGSVADVDRALALVPDRSRIVTVAARDRAEAEGFRYLVGSNPDSAAWRNSVRADLIALASRGELRLPIARTFPLTDARAALDLVASGRPGGKVALIPSSQP